MSVSTVEINNLISSFVGRGACQNEKEASLLNETIDKIHLLRELDEAEKEFDAAEVRGEVFELTKEYGRKFGEKVKNNLLERQSKNV